MPSFSRAIFDGTSESLSNGQSEQNGFPNGNGFQEKYYLDGHDDQDPIVVTGFAARLPQDADSSPGFWNLICQGRNASTNIPEDRVKMNAFYHPNPERPDTTNVRRGNFLKGNLAEFDASFFSIQPIEAESMDPQQRCLLETSYQALENAGVPLQNVAGSNTSVYIAASNRDYEVMLYRDPEQTPKYMGTGIGTSLLSNRLSWFFDFHGPSLSIDTACSGSLTAMNLACDSLQRHESNMALVGGVSLILSPEVSMTQLSTLGFLSPDGISYSFDSRANGYAKGEGVAVVVLKRLSDAIKDNDTIRSVVRAVSVNQDGRTPGITQPSKAAQAANIRQAYERNGLRLDRTQYFEAHGTGTAVGDPIEASAIHDAFQRSAKDPIYVGSLKANIGHLEAGAGIAAVIKSTLMLENGVMPPNACFENPNPNIPLDEWNVKFLRHPIVFPKDTLRRISINNFGYGGTNAHAVIDDALSYLKARNIQAKHNTIARPSLQDLNGAVNGEESKLNGSAPKLNGSASKLNGNGLKLNGHVTDISAQESQENGDWTHDTSYKSSVPYVLFWSAADENGIKRSLESFTDHFSNSTRKSPDEERSYLRSLAYTLASRRSNLPWKSFSIVENMDQLYEGLTADTASPLRSYNTPSLSFVFTGQGAQWYAMTQGLTRYPVFAESLRKSELYLSELSAGWSLASELNKDKRSSLVDEPSLSQPLCTVLQIALVDLLKSWCVTPVTVVGHSSGEIAAAYCTGALSHASAIKIAFYRGYFVTKLQEEGSYEGGMMAVALSEKDIEPYIEEASSETGGRISVGCSNSPGNVTVTGDSPAISALQEIMNGEGIFARRLQVSVAYHSYHMQSIAQKYMAAIKDIVPPQVLEKKKKDVPQMFSSVTGKPIRRSDLCTSEYWTKNLVSKVRFTEAAGSMMTYLLEMRKQETGNKSGRDILVEIGPHPALQRPIKDIIKELPGAKNFDYDSTVARDKYPLVTLISLAGRLRCQGCDIDLTTVNFPEKDTSGLRTLTDLPSYVFNHGTTYWVESRMSKAFRFREHGRHELLGAREHDWNPLRPRWRNLIRLSEHPWIRDHKFGGSCLYPASGMLSMAIEGARQLAEPQDITGYHLQDVAFLNSFAVPPDEEFMETQLHFDPRKLTVTGKTAKAYDFTIFAWFNDSWNEICRGGVTVSVSQETSKSDSEITKRLRQEGLGDLLDKNFGRNWETISSEEFYDSVAKMRYDFGPTFCNLSGLRSNEVGEALTTLGLDEWSSKVDSSPILPHVIHPVDLDSFLQSTVAAHSQGGRQDISILVPFHIKSLWVSHGLLHRGPRTHLRLLTRSTFRGYREADFSSGAVDSDNQVRVLIHGFRQTSPDNQALEIARNATPKRLCYAVKWKPDPDLLGRDAIVDLCGKAVDPNIIPSFDQIDRQELVSLYYMNEAQKVISKARIQEMPDYLQKYMGWIDHQLNMEEVQALRKSHPENERLFGSEEDRDAFLAKFSEKSPEGRLIVETGKSLLPILNGELDALDLLLAGDLVSDYYRSLTFNICIYRLLTYVDLVAHKNPSMDILEIGAGTGGATVPILECLSGHANHTNEMNTIPRYKRYTFTDVSPAFFEKARETLKSFQNVGYEVLNIEKDPSDQGFKEAQYDMVICSAVLHATTNLRETMMNVRKLLKPGGKLVLSEPTAPKTARASFIFGLLPGWWLGSEEERKWCPLVEDDYWHRLLLETGFDGVQVSLPDQPDPYRRTFSGLLSAAVDPKHSKEPTRKFVIVASENSSTQVELAKALRGTIAKTEHEASILFSDQLPTQESRNSFIVSLLEMDAPFFHEISEEAWSNFKEAVPVAAGVFWINQNCGVTAAKPEVALTKGMGRAIRSEFPGIVFIELTLDEGSIDSKATKILQVLTQSLATNESEPESEYLEHEGHLSIARAIENFPLNQKIHNSIHQGKPVVQDFGTDSRALTLTIASPGLLDTLRFEDDDQQDSAIGPTEVDIEVAATGVNFKDMMILMGKLAGNAIGFECSGVIVRRGAESSFQIGDKVCCCTPKGAYKTFVRADSSAVMKIPSQISLVEAAGLPTVFATAYYALVYLANLQEGESVLIHSGAGGVGQAAIQLAQRLKANIFTTVGADTKRTLLKDHYGIPDDHIFSSRSTDFAEAVKERTSGGVDVILNSLSGEGQLASWQCIAPLGRFVELGKEDIQSRRKLPMDPFSKNVSFSSVSLDIVMEKSKSLMGQIMAEISKLFSDASRPIKLPDPLSIYRVEHIEQAFRLMQTGNHVGKLVIQMNKDGKVPVLPSLKPTHMFSKNATYVIAGGLGGLGRTMVRWMVTRNARNFVLLSRSGAEGNQAAKELIQEMSALGVRIEAPRCDVTNERAVSTALEGCKGRMPPVKGLIQGSMVLNDGLFQLMPSASLHAVLRPKTIGTMNLSKCLPRDLDFFVILSSIASMTGTRGQANYVAANTFQDALARNLVVQGRHCVSLNLGAIKSVGYAAENDLDAVLRKDGFEGVSKAELLSLLDYCCDPNCLATLRPYDSQVVSGLAGAETLEGDHFRSVYWTNKAMFRNLVHLSAMRDASDNKDTSKGSKDDLSSLLSSAPSQDAAVEIALRALIDRFAKVMTVSAADIDPQRPISTFGIDSLVSLELRYWMQRELKAEINVIEIMSAAGLEGMASMAVTRSEFWKGGQEKS